MNSGNMAPEAVLLTTHYVTVNRLKTGEQVSFIGVSFQRRFFKIQELHGQLRLLMVIFNRLGQRRSTKCRGRFKAEESLVVASDPLCDF